jgi:hypothetical protein
MWGVAMAEDPRITAQVPEKLPSVLLKTLIKSYYGFVAAEFQRSKRGDDAHC